MRVIAYSLLCLGMVWGADCVAQQSGGLDSLFHFDGELVLTDFDSVGNPVVVATEDMGAVIAFKQTVEGAEVTQMVRLLENGSLHPGFGQGGVVTITSLGSFRDLVIQGDGKPMLIGWITSAPDTGVVVGRFLENGAVDSSYGVQGRVLVPGTSTPLVNFSYTKMGGTILPDGRLLLHLNNRIIRLQSDGAIDPSFGSQGVLSVPTGVGTIALTPTGRLRWAKMGLALPNEVDYDGQDSILGYQLFGNWLTSQFSFVRGSFGVNCFDQSFGQCSGAATTQTTLDLDGFSRIDGLTLEQPHPPHPVPSHWVGSMRSVFMFGQTPVGGSNGVLGPIAVDQAGNFLMSFTFTGTYGIGLQPFPAPVWRIKRMTPSSTDIDTTFGTGAPTQVPMNIGFDASFDSTAFPTPLSMMVQPDGKVVVAGTCSVGGIKRVVLARYHNIPDPRAKLDLKLFLGGPMDTNTGLMHDSLRAQGLLPLQQPYLDSTYQSVNGVGAGMTSTAVLNETGAEAAVDWVWLELLDAADTATVVATRTGLLRRNGTVTSPVNHDPIDFSVGAGSYFLRVRHRNHLGVTLSDPIVLSNTVVSIDLSDPTTYTFGTAAQKWINGVHMLWPGDVNHDGLIRYAGSANDRDAVLVTIGGSPPTATSIGYKNADANMDGIVKYAGVDNDRDVILQSIGGGYPTVVRFEQRP